VSALDTHSPADRSTGLATSVKSHADHNVLNCGVVHSGGGFRRGEAGFGQLTVINISGRGTACKKPPHSLNVT